jgi:hypothetical protein
MNIRRRELLRVDRVDSENIRLRHYITNLEAVLVVMARCPGVDTTDQETGETFRTHLNRRCVVKARR